MQLEPRVVTLSAAGEIGKVCYAKCSWRDRVSTLSAAGGDRMVCCHCMVIAPNNKPHQSPKQSHTEDRTEQIEPTSGEDHRRRTGRLQSRKEYHREDLQPTHPV